MRIGLIILFLSISSALSSQTILTIEGQPYVNTQTDWNGVVISNSTPTTFTFRNNSITSVNQIGYMLLAGEEASASTNNNLDGAVIIGNKLTWNGTTDLAFHGIMTGYNKNDIIKYNYLDKVPYGVVFKSGSNAGVNMIYTSGGLAYNIVINSGIGVRIKGINGVSIYNNTFYDDQHTNNGNAIIHITSNSSVAIPAGSTGTKIKNNIFYTTHQIACIYVEEGSEVDFESDYNVFYCTAGTPVFNYQGTGKTFTEWQALGYDKHSVVVNPNFKDFTDFVPTIRLDYGMDLGTSWQTGLSTTAAWTLGASPATVNQNGTWQVGARIYDAISVTPYYISSVVENNTPTILIMTYSLSLANIVPSTSAFNVQVNSVSRTVNSVAIVGGKVQLTLASTVAYGNNITVAYSKPADNPLQTVSGDQAASITVQPVVNNCINISPTVIIISPGDGSSFVTPATITITANASDVDGTITKVEFYSGSTKLGEKVTAPYSFTWNNIEVGTYSLTAVANDNFNAKNTSSAISISVYNGTPPANKPPTVSITSPVNSSSYTSPATITITANASDSDGTISKVAFFNGALKLAEITTAPYLYTWTKVNSGTYVLTAIATDNSNATASSASIMVHVSSSNDANTELINLFPNPNEGYFTIEITRPTQNESNKISIVNFAGKIVYDGILLKEEITKQFDLSFLDSGIYILMIIGKEILMTIKFIKN